MKKRASTQIRDLTPSHRRCLAGACPAVFETQENSYLLIGKVVDRQSFGEAIAKRVGEGECLIEVPADLLDEILQR